MKIAFTTTFDSRDVQNWSGTPFYMSTAFVEQGMDVEYVGNLTRQLPKTFKLKQTLKKILSNQRESPRFNITSAQHYSRQVAEYLKQNPADVILSPRVNPICYLETDKPVVLWTDCLYAGLVGFYPGFSNHSSSTIAQGNTITRECLSRCDLAIFSSDWAARTALEIYGIDRDKVKVVPFGANIEQAPTLEEVCGYIRQRSKSVIQLLFIGKNWQRKGGKIVFDVAHALHASGHAVELHIIGCVPPHDLVLPSYVHCHGFVSKRTDKGREKITRLLRESHFLFVPSRAEAYGIVFCEANAYGLPCLTTYVGGISTIIKDSVNGMTFSLDASTETYCNYIVNAMKQYEEMALTAFHEYEKRLNWRVAVKEVTQLIHKL